MLIKGSDSEGNPVKQDIGQGLEYLTKAAERGDSEAMIYLGVFLKEGHEDFKADLKKAREWLEKAAAADNPDGRYQLAVLLLEDEEGTRDDKKIFELADSAASAGIIEARLLLSDMCLKGRGVKRSIKRAIAILDELAKAGIPEADYRLSLIYKDDRTSYFRPQKAQGLLEKAARKDVPGALKDLAKYYWTLDWTHDDFDPGTAFVLYRRYLKLVPDDGEALFKIADYILIKKMPVKEAYAGEGRDCLKRAAAAGYPPAQLFLGVMHLKGDNGFEKNEKQGRDLILKAGRGDDPQVWVDVGRMYRAGIVFVRDLPEALKYFRRAAAEDNAEAHYELGCMYRDGFGLPRNMHEARSHFLASLMGDSMLGRFEYGKMLTQSADKKEVSMGLAYVEDAAEAGMPEAMALLRDFYLNKGLKATGEEREKGVYYGHAAVAVASAIMYQSHLPYPPKGVLLHTALAFVIVSNAADSYDFDKPDPRTYVFNAAGHCWEGGVARQADIEKAVAYYEKGARLKEPYALMSLSRLYREGRGVKKDVMKAAQLQRQGDEIIEQRLKKAPGGGKKAPAAEKKENEVSLG